MILVLSYAAQLFFPRYATLKEGESSGRIFR